MRAIKLLALFLVGAGFMLVAPTACHHYARSSEFREVQTTTGPTGAVERSTEVKIEREQGNVPPGR